MGWLEGEFKFRNHLNKAAVVGFFGFGRVRKGEVLAGGIDKMIE